MKKVCSLIDLLLVCGGVFFANTPALDLFKYDAAKMNGGTMYTYKVSDFEGENEILVYVYLDGDNKVEFYNDYSNLSNALFSGKFDLHKTYFMSSFIEGGNPLGYLAIPNSNNYSEVHLDYPNRKTIGDMYYWDKHGKSAFKSFTYDDFTWPSYEMSSNMLDFGLAMRHFTGTRDSPFFELVKYKNYKMGGFWSKQQSVLLDTTAMTADEWKTHCDAITERAKTQFGY